MIDYTYLDLYNRTSKDPVSSIDKQLIITVDDGTVITNSNIHGENFELTEGICSDRNLKFGSCESSQVKFRITNDVETLKNKWITITEVLDGHRDEPFTFGTYMVDSDRPRTDITGMWLRMTDCMQSPEQITLNGTTASSFRRA